jgi:alpha-tubulin suppressor-like RCC1 family protein
MESVFTVQDTVFQGVQGNPKTRELLTKLLETFRDSSYTEMRLPPHLNPSQRKIAHTKAEEFGFEHVSEQIENSDLKVLVIRKLQPTVEEEPTVVEEELNIPVVEYDMPEEISISCVEVEEGYVSFELSWASYSRYIVQSVSGCFSEKPEEGESSHVLAFREGALELVEGNPRSIVIDYLEDCSLYNLVFRYQPNHFSTFRIDGVPQSGSVLVSFTSLPTNRYYTLSSHSSNTEFDSITTHLKVYLPTIHSGMLYTWGDNQHAQQGFVQQDAILTPIVHPSYPETLRIASLSTGHKSAALVTSIGELHTWGLLPNINEKGEHGLSAFGPSIMRLDEDVIFVKVSCGENYMGALSITGDIYTWGYATHTQLGRGFIKYSSQPTKIESLDPPREKAPYFIDISCGTACALACSDSGKVYEWGNCIVPFNCMYVDLHKPKEMAGYHSVISVSAGNRYQSFVTSEGVAYTWGFNVLGQCGLGHTEVVSYPVEVSLPGVSKLACGDSHTLFLTRTGELYGCGQARDGALGLNCREIVTRPTRVECEFEVKDVAVGSVYSLVLNTCNQAMVCGSGKMNCLGIGVAGKASKLRKLKINEKVSAFSAGFDYGISIVSNRPK